LTVEYGGLSAVHDFSVEIASGEIVAIIGPNGAGKTSIARALLGMVRGVGGQRTLTGARASHDLTPYKPSEIAQLGIAYVSNERPIFESLTVVENLNVAFSCVAVAKQSKVGLLEDLYTRFRWLEERRYQRAGSLSGGEKRKLALARAFIQISALALTRGRKLFFPLLVLDEPTSGLDPQSIDSLRVELAANRSSGIAILLLDQSLTIASSIADRAILLSRGEAIHQGKAVDVLRGPLLDRLLLGVV